MLSRFDRAVGVLCTGGLWMSATIALAIVSIVALEVVCRTFLGTSLFVVEEFVGYLLAAFTMFGLAPTLRSGRILRVEVVYARLTPAWQARAQVVFHIVGLAYLVILESQLIRLVMTSYQRDIVSVTLMAFPVWIPQALVALGGALLLLALVDALLRDGRTAVESWRRS